MKREFTRGGYRVVLDDGTMNEHREYLLSAIDSYAFMLDKQVKIVFFNADVDGEKGVTFLWR